MEVYNGYLYIGDYNDVTQATYPMLQMDFIHLATLLSQSVNLYRMNGQHEIELVVGDKTQTFPNGSISGLESGYMGLNGHGSRINQYTSMTQIWDTDKTDDNDGVMLLGTLDEGSLLRPLIQIMNGDVLKMSEDEWKEKINYLKVLIQLLVEKNLGGDSATADLFADAAADDASSDDSALTAEEEVARALAAAQSFDLRNGAQLASEFDENVDPDAVSEPISLTPEQTASLVEGIENGTIVPHSMDAGRAVEALSLTYGMSTITDLVSASGQENIEAFYEVYRELVEYYQDLKDSGYVELPEALEKMLDQVLTVESARQLRALLTCLNSVSTSVIGCDTYAITTDANGGNFAINEVTLDGLGDNSNQTMRNFALTDDYVVFIPGNAVRGGSVYRLADWPGKTDPTPDPEPDKYEVTLRNAGDGATGAGKYAANETVTITAGTRPGYVFRGWTSDDVQISDARSETASFTMPAQDVTVQANWARRSSGGSSSSTLYNVIVKDSKNGEVTSSHKQAASGATVTLTAKPDQGYVLGTLTVLDSRNKEVKLTAKADGTYTFTMPASDVTVQAVFRARVHFRDVPSGAYYEDAVNWAVANGITNGMTADLFDPNGICTRAQAVTFLWRAAGSPAPKSSAMPFTDVPADSYFYNAVLWAVENGITKGTSDTTFSPSTTCSRAQIVTFLWRSQSSPAAGSANPFTDVSASAYYADAVLWAVKENITKGTSSTTFSPADNCTRAQIVTFIWRTLA